MAPDSDETGTRKEKCPKFHADVNPNCTGRCQRDEGHDGKHRDQHGHEW